MIPACNARDPLVLNQVDEVEPAISVDEGEVSEEVDDAEAVVKHAPFPTWVRGKMGDYALANAKTLSFNLDLIGDKTGTARSMFSAAPKMLDIFFESGYLEAEFAVGEISPPKVGSADVLLSIRKVINISPGPDNFKAERNPQFELFTRRVAGKVQQKCVVYLTIERKEGDSTQDLGKRLIQKINSMSIKDLSVLKGETLFSDQELQQIFSGR